MGRYFLSSISHSNFHMLFFRIDAINTYFVLCVDIFVPMTMVDVAYNAEKLLSYDQTIFLGNIGCINLISCLLCIFLLLKADAFFELALLNLYNHQIYQVE